MDAQRLHEPGIQVEFLTPEGAAAFTRLVRRCYRDSYDAAWVSDPDEVAARLRAGTFWSTVGVGRPLLPRDRRRSPPSRVPAGAHHNDRVVTVRTVGADLLDVLTTTRDETLARAAACVYVQHLDRVTLDTGDIELASDHGRHLLDYVTA